MCLAPDADLRHVQNVREGSLLARPADFLRAQDGIIAADLLRRMDGRKPLEWSRKCKSRFSWSLKA
jgi:hypothetical protein